MFMNSIPFIFAIATGIILILIARVSSVADKERNILKDLVSGKKARKNLLDDLLNDSKFIHNLEEKNKMKLALVNDDFDIRKFTKIILLTTLIGIIFSLFIMNFIAMPFIIFISFYMPQLYLNLVATNKRNKIESQLGIAIKFFTSEFSTTKQVVVSLQNILPKLPKPIRGEFEKLSRELNSSGTPRQTLSNFASRMNNKYAYIFAKLLTSYYESGTEFSQHLIRLTSDITDNELTQQEGKAEVAMVRTTNLLLNGTVLVSVIVMFVFIPEKSVYFKDSIGGQALMAVAIINAFLSVILGLKLEH